MRKFIIAAAAATTMLSSSAALASTEDAFYLSGKFAWNKMKEETMSNLVLNSKKVNSFKLKSENAFALGLGVGYYLMDNVRLDLMLDHYFDPEVKGSSKNEDSKNLNAKSKGDINALTVNAYMDLFDLSVARMFVGAGAGMAQMKQKFTFSYPDEADVKDVVADSKSSNNFTYSLHVGATMEIAPGVNGDLTYSWRDFGKTKSYTNKDNGHEVKSVDVKGHNLAFGVRFDM